MIYGTRATGMTVCRRIQASRSGMTHPFEFMKAVTRALCARNLDMFRSLLLASINNHPTASRTSISRCSRATDSAGSIASLATLLLASLLSSPSPIRQRPFR
jgi:hypothetical protein